MSHANKHTLDHYFRVPDDEPEKAFCLRQEVMLLRRLGKQNLPACGIRSDLEDATDFHPPASDPDDHETLTEARADVRAEPHVHLVELWGGAWPPVYNRPTLESFCKPTACDDGVVAIFRVCANRYSHPSGYMEFVPDFSFRKSVQVVIAEGTSRETLMRELKQIVDELDRRYEGMIFECGASSMHPRGIHAAGHIRNNAAPAPRDDAIRVPRPAAVLIEDRHAATTRSLPRPSLAVPGLRAATRTDSTSRPVRVRRRVRPRAAGGVAGGRE